MFDQFRADLDDYNDRKERLIKQASRDVTIKSKRTIFLLHRIALEDTSNSAQRAAASGREKLKEVQQIYALLRSEITGDRFWQYHRQISPGIQEYVEALSFAHYLEHRTLITLKQAQQTLCDPNGQPYFTLPISDYLLGISDLTGELMRYAISAVGKYDGRIKISEVCTFVRACKADLERMSIYASDLSKKQVVTAQSLEKIEAAAYALALRRSEYDSFRDRSGFIVVPPADSDQLKGKATDKTEGEVF